jgi:hypothetical protein
VFFLSAAVLLCELFGVCVSARASKLGIHLQEKRKAQAQQQQQQEVHLQKVERGSFALEKDDLGRERKPFVLFFLFLYEVGPSTAEETLCLCVCVMTTVGQFGRKSSLAFSFFFSFFCFGVGWQPRDSILSRTLSSVRKKTNRN